MISYMLTAVVVTSLYEPTYMESFVSYCQKSCAKVSICTLFDLFASLARLISQLYVCVERKRFRYKVPLLILLLIRLLLTIVEKTHCIVWHIYIFKFFRNLTLETISINLFNLCNSYLSIFAGIDCLPTGAELCSKMAEQDKNFPME